MSPKVEAVERHHAGWNIVSLVWDPPTHDNSHYSDAAGFVRASTTAAPVLERTRHALRSYLAMLFGVPCWQLIGVPTSHRGHWFVLTADAADRGPKSRRSLRCRGYASPVLRSVYCHRAATVVDSLARHFCDASWLARVARADAEPIRDTRTRRMSSIICAGACIAQKRKPTGRSSAAEKGVGLQPYGHLRNRLDGRGDDHAAAEKRVFRVLEQLHATRELHRVA